MFHQLFRLVILLVPFIPLYSRKDLQQMNLWKINIITNAISSAITFLENEIQCVEDECLAEEYQAVIDELTNALRTAQEMANP